MIVFALLGLETVEHYLRAEFLSFSILSASVGL